MAESSDSELLARELTAIGNKVRGLETRFTELEARLSEVEEVIERLEAAAATTARALDEVAARWDAVYKAMRGEE